MAAGGSPAGVRAGRGPHPARAGRPGRRRRGGGSRTARASRPFPFPVRPQRRTDERPRDFRTGLGRRRGVVRRDGDRARGLARGATGRANRSDRSAARGVPARPRHDGGAVDRGRERECCGRTHGGVVVSHRRPGGGPAGARDAGRSRGRGARRLRAALSLPAGPRLDGRGPRAGIKLVVAGPAHDGRQHRPQRGGRHPADGRGGALRRHLCGRYDAAGRGAHRLRRPAHGRPAAPELSWPRRSPSRCGTSPIRSRRRSAGRS